MNYFELFDLPVSFRPNRQKVTQQYFTLQKKFHPDFFANATVAEKEEVLELSAQANKAYKIFQNEDATIKYVLQLKGLLEEDEKYNLPPDFLMEVLELNEMKMDGADEETVRKRAAFMQDEIRSAVSDILENYKDDDNTSARLLQVKDYYYKNRYLQRLIDGDLKH